MINQITKEYRIPCDQPYQRRDTELSWKNPIYDVREQVTLLVYRVPKQVQARNEKIEANLKRANEQEKSEVDYLRD